MFSIFRRTFSLLNAEQGQLLLRVESFEERLIKAMKELEAKKEVAKEANKYVPRYNGKIKKRQWDDTKGPQPEKKPRTEGEEQTFERIKRKKSIILLGYSGVNYFGMQRNPGMKTIEEELLEAMKKTNWITEEAFDHPQWIGFQRAARTDKGVSACMQCVSLKLPETLDIEAINKDLPEQIKVFCVKRVTKGFNSKDQCDFRTYSYTLPTIAFEDHSTVIGTEESQISMDTYRLSAEKLKKVNETLKLYEGTKNYHNFTARKAPFDPSARRFMVSVECGEPFLIRNQFEFATIKIKGQSFMLHQIRKMIGLMLAVVRGLTPMDTIVKSFKEEKIDIPTAPGLGLVLNQVHYDRYNKRYGDDGLHEKLIFDEYRDQIEEFAEKHIISTIVETEIKEKPMLEWLQNLHRHTYEVREEDNTDIKDEDIDE